MTSISELVAALESVPQHFGTLAPSAHAGQLACSTADLLSKLTLTAADSDISSAWDAQLERWEVRSSCKLMQVCVKGRALLLRRAFLPAAGRSWRQHTACRSWRLPPRLLLLNTLCHLG